MQSDPTKKLEKALSENDVEFLVEMAQEEKPPKEQKPPAKK